ncbi:MAG: hypothetical protein OXI84_07015 [bacterium]|nr:hypothetical protein [bacterium]
MDTQTAAVRSKKAEVLRHFEERRDNEEEPFGGVLKFLQDQGSDLDDVDVAVAIGRLVCDGKLRYALDGIRLVPE